MAAAWHSQRTPPVVVARYVRTLLLNASHASLAAMEAGLGLTPASLARLHLRVEDPTPEPTPMADAANIDEARRRWEEAK